MHPNSIQSFTSPAPFGTLIIIPVELRLKIYGVIERGQVDILRTSRAINKEAFDDFYKNAVCRLKIDFYSPFRIFPGQAPSNSIQNLDFQVTPWKSIQDLELDFNITHKGIIYFNEWLQRFCSNRTDLKVCKIRLDHKYRSITFLPKTLTAIRTPAAFQKVILVIAMVNQDTVTSMKAFATSLWPDPDRYMYLDMHSKVQRTGWLAHDWAKSFLEPTLGGAVRLEDNRSMHLEFYPQRIALLASSEDKDAEMEEED